MIERYFREIKDGETRYFKYLGNSCKEVSKDEVIDDLISRIKVATDYIVKNAYWKRSKEKYGFKGNKEQQFISTSELLNILDGKYDRAVTK